MTFIALVARIPGTDFNENVLRPFLRRILNHRQEDVKTLQGWWLIFTGSSVTFWSETLTKLGHTWDQKGPGQSNVDMALCFDWGQPCDDDGLHKHPTQKLVLRPQQGKKPRGTQAANQFRINAWSIFLKHWKRVLGRRNGVERKERSSSPLSVWDVVVYTALGNRF